MALDSAATLGARQSAVDPGGRHHQLENLHVMDDSVFPTSIGANPQLSIYAVVARFADDVAARLAARRDGTLT